MSKQADFLIEIGTEELPPKSLPDLERAFRERLEDGLRASGLQADSVASFAAPRRLAVLASKIPVEQAARQVEKRGPPLDIAFAEDGSPTRAALAFADGCGVSVESLERVETSKGAWLFYRGEEAGKTAAELLPELVEQALAALPIARRMRWGNGDTEFVRPVHWVVMLLGRDVVEARILGCPTGNETRGHRFHAPGPIRIERAERYADRLRRKGQVIADFDERRSLIREQAERAAHDLGGEAMLDPEVLDEVTALVEWPVAITGSFDERYLELPAEVLTATLQDHQRYFPVSDRDGRLLSRFIAISNIDSREPSQIQNGNERVVRPRLADAEFFWQRDTRRTLHSRCDDLREVVFERTLGSLHDKSVRVTELAVELAPQLGADPDTARRAAMLAKTDLLTDMVGEFPELQGVIGHHYARHDGEAAAVAAAIEEQYLPRHAGDGLPASPAGQVLALTDRLDTLAGIFSLGRKPSGKKDPFGLRRAALGLLRILIESRIDLDLEVCIDKALRLQPAAMDDRGKVAGELFDFIVDRLRAWYLDGIAPGLATHAVTAEMFEAVRARRPVSPLDFHQRLTAVQSFMSLDAAESLAMANKRIANILKSSDESAVEHIDPDLFEAQAERQLHEAVAALAESHRAVLAERDYVAVLSSLSALREPVDEFFDAVMVNTDDPARRRNRLAQLWQLRAMFLDVADLSLIPGA